MTDVVHQIRYGWSQSSLLGTRGMGPVQSTMPDAELHTWDRYLRDHVWAVGAGGREPGFTFIVREDVGALLRKVPATSPSGRQGSETHALLSRRLSARLALGLTCWAGWGAPLAGPLAWPALERAVEQGLDVLRTRVRMIPPDRLANLFTQLLSAPGESYTVIGEPDPRALVCALGDLLGATPSFATDEPDDVRPDLPTAVFLREAPVSATTVTRRRLNPAAPHDPVLSPFAAAAVEAYFADGMAGVAGLWGDQPPANAAEAREWARDRQFAPGILADLTRLGRLNPAVWERLEEPATHERIRSAAAAASPRVLLRALDGGLPDSVMAILVREAVARASSAPGDGALLERLARFGPLPVDLVAASLPSGFDNLVRMTRALLAYRDRRGLLEQAAQHIPLAALIRWADEHAAADPDAVRAVYSALCGRLHRASIEDVWTLVSRRMLVDAVRRIAESEQQVSVYLGTVLGALPTRTLTRPEVFDALLEDPDPALLHALDTVVTDSAQRGRIQYVVRLAYYRSHDLPEPRRASAEGGAAGRRRWWPAGRWPRLIPRRNLPNAMNPPNPSNPGKPM